MYTRGVFNRRSAYERSPKFPITATQILQGLAIALSAEHAPGTGVTTK